MVTLKRYMTLVQAERDKSLLEAAGISAFVAGENSAAAGYGGVLGELQLQVQEADVDRARRVLDQHEGFAPLPDNFVPPEQPARPGPRLETMEKDSNNNIVWSVVITLLFVMVFLQAFAPRGLFTSSTSSNSRAQQQAYEERVRRSEALMTSQEHNHERWLDYFAKIQEDQQRTRASLERQEADQQRFEKILATWEQQQQEYEKYLDSLPKKQ